eukprot:CAMPEP_0118969804 /NCGR_PEP_ID=MMETSP1173-20130426/6840_1 /TAXON_ID=1034831 /ORGANISM="Rhizochromulina marina cf, Strain CCMP1243" /LENGTH=57 /DNA_ID=CAMNT_0006919087 /DNA_START=45 /DNA_END=218 /DNA_ORIENTATION=-
MSGANSAISSWRLDKTLATPRCWRNGLRTLRLPPRASSAATCSSLGTSHSWISSLPR